MRGFLDFSDDSFAVALQWTRYNHEPNELKIAFQSVTAHLPDLRYPKDSAQFLTVFMYRMNHTISVWIKEF